MLLVGPVPAVQDEVEGAAVLGAEEVAGLAGGAVAQHRRVLARQQAGHLALGAVEGQVHHWAAVEALAADGAAIAVEGCALVGPVGGFGHGQASASTIAMAPSGQEATQRPQPKQASTSLALPASSARTLKGQAVIQPP